MTRSDFIHQTCFEGTIVYCDMCNSGSFLHYYEQIKGDITLCQECYEELKKEYDDN